MKKLVLGFLMVIAQLFGCVASEVSPSQPSTSLQGCDAENRVIAVLFLAAVIGGIEMLQIYPAPAPVTLQYSDVPLFAHNSKLRETVEAAETVATSALPQWPKRQRGRKYFSPTENRRTMKIYNLLTKNSVQRPKK